MPELTTRTVTSLESVEAASWDGLAHEGCPFTEHGFLRALECSGSVGGATGWRPVYILVEDRAPSAVSTGSRPDVSTGSRPDVSTGARPDVSPPVLVGAVAAYVKSHSYGEFIFDWTWARAAIQAGLPYYPKLVIAAPLTPVTGPRLLIAPTAERDAVVARLIAGVRSAAAAAACSSIHWLFTTAREQEELARHGFLSRASHQYHWHNRGYPDFAAFLGEMTSRRRKQVRKERERAQAAIDALEWIPGPALAPADLAAIDRYYRSTVSAHGGQDYLAPGFFGHVHRLMPERMLWARARRGERTIAGALFFATEAALYGRYWGADEDARFLHFEAAYYAPIERCILRGTPRFEAGAQGEHKLLRGLAPARTYSSHWFAHTGLAAAVGRYLQEEAAAVEQQLVELAEYLPFRADE